MAEQKKEALEGLEDEGVVPTLEEAKKDPNDGLAGLEDIEEKKQEPLDNTPDEDIDEKKIKAAEDIPS